MAISNTDIYNIRSSVEDLKKQYIPEDEDTLALGIFGYLGDIESKKIQTAVMMVGELENEVFPNRAKLDKNIITHAIMQNINDINATPAEMEIVLGIDVADLDKYMVNGKFIIDKNFVLIIENENTKDRYDYHLDYDVVLTRSNRGGNNAVYAAVYDIEDKNPISKITNPYLKQPWTIKMNDKTYVFIQCVVHQVKMVSKYNQIVNSNIIDNKTFTFEFDDQLAYFTVTVKDRDKTIKLVPIFEGAAIPKDVEYFCYYTYITTNIIRIKFERTSYMPRFNSEVRVDIATTKGSNAIFTYKDDIYTTLSSEKYGYDNIVLFIRPNTGSKGGVDRKSVEELHNIIPKEILSRGCITTETDLMNYFNLINTDDTRLTVMKKIDNQIERIYYSYFVMRNSNNDIVPTNTIDIDIRDIDFHVYEENGTSVLPAGTIIEYDPETHIGKVVEHSDSEYVYSTLYALLVNINPLYAASYITTINENPYLSFEYINQTTELQFISKTTNFRRRLLVDKDTYTLTFTMNQNINIPFYENGLSTNDAILSDLQSKIKAVVVLYKNGNPYRYVFADLVQYKADTLLYTFECKFVTDNMYDLNNNIKILDMYIAGYNEKSYGYVNDSSEARIFMLVKFDKDFGKHGLDSIVPNELHEGYSVTNVFEIYGGLTFFINYTSLTNSRIEVSENEEECNRYMYSVKSVPVLGYDYTTYEDHVFDFIDRLNYNKYYIDNAMLVLENSFEVDFKFYNTYGPSRTYTIDETGTTSIGRVDASLKFALSLKTSADEYTKNEIVYDIKNYIEDLDGIYDYHIPNLVSYITNKYSSAINYFGWVGFNEFDANEQHMIKQELYDKNICPEFINVRNTYDIDGNVAPCIDIVTIIN